MTQYPLKDELIKLVTSNPSVLLKRNSDNEYILSVPDNLIAKEPLTIRFDENIKEFNIRLIIKIGKNAKATLVERFENTQGQTIMFHSRIFAEKESDLRLITFQNLTIGSKLTEVREVEVKKSANVHFINFQLGAKDVRSTLQQVSANEYGNLNADLLCRTHNDQNHRFDISSVYRSKNGKGRIIAKGIALDKSQLMLNGAISITNKGGGTDTHLRQDSLLLSKDASIRTTPKLNIATNDVKAGHGASVTNLNNDSLFYMASRGINHNDAKKLLINGFATEQLDKINDLPELRNEIFQII